MRKIINDNPRRVAEEILSLHPRIVCLTGRLGAGKTTVAQEMFQMLGVVDDVVSPTFSIINVYTARRRDSIEAKSVGDAEVVKEVGVSSQASLSDTQEVYHLDLYRLDDATELFHIGYDDIVDFCSFAVIEWADKFRERIPEDAIWVELGIEADGSRYALLPKAQDVPNGKTL